MVSERARRNVAHSAQCLPSVFFAPGSTDRGNGNTNGDWFSFLFALGVSQLGIPNFDVALWSRAISLLLTGIIVLASLAQILRSVGRVIRLASKTAAVGFLLLSLGQLFVSHSRASTLSVVHIHRLAPRPATSFAQR